MFNNMAKFYKGYECISTELINFTGNDLARQVVRFGQLSEVHEGRFNENDPYGEYENTVIDEIIHGKTFPKYALEGHNVTFQVNNISRINLAQFTRERGFFCSASSGVRPLTQEFITPLSIYNNKEWMERLEKIQSDIESLYIDMCEAGIPYMDSRYFGFHAQTISLTYNACISDWLRSCNSRTENNFADEINYMYRLMYRDLKTAIRDTVTDPLSKKLWDWLMSMADRKSYYKRDHNYNNDFERFKSPEGYIPDEPARNDWRNSAWKLELERILEEEPELLFPGEKEMIEKWQELERSGIELPTTYVKDNKMTPPTRIKTVDYYNK